MDINIIAQDFYFCHTGVYKSIKVIDSPTGSDTTDIEEICTNIRIAATSQEQIDKTFNEYINNTDLMLDESYDFKIEPKGSYWYKIFGKEKAERINKEVSEKLEIYKQKMEEDNIKVLIINLK